MCHEAIFRGIHCSTSNTTRFQFIDSEPDSCFFSNFVPRSSLFTLFCMLWLCWWELQKSVMWFVYPSNYHSTRPIAIRPWILLSHPSTIYTEGPMNVMGIKRWRRCLYTWTICWVFLRNEIDVWIQSRNCFLGLISLSPDGMKKNYCKEKRFVGNHRDISYGNETADQTSDHISWILYR